MEDFTPFYRSTPIEYSALPSGIGFPVRYAIIRRKILNNTFGMVRRNADGSRRPHQGWDFYAPPGCPCYAIADGEVAAVRSVGAYGRHAILRFAHRPCGSETPSGVEETFFAAYCHLNAVAVAPGQRVRQGDLIGHCGDSGNARGMVGTDAHLHFEIRTHLAVGRGLSRRLSPLALFGVLPLDRIMVSDRAYLPKAA
jgi:murein DD-endopeptidase MepM/ murein hydrolase activator NlpD